jgi:tyrosyl-tRNA synthetase
VARESSTGVIGALKERELVAQVTGGDELEAHLGAPRTVYCGFDPTADSLHIGSLIPLLALRRFQLAGHRPIALVGGATGLIGDPSHKAEERQLHTREVVAEWAERLKAQVGRFIDCDSGAAQALVVNNLDWFGAMPVLDFLRDIGKHFSVNAMIHKEAVRQRIEREETGISFTEFSYALLQSFDFAELYRRYGCTVQIGGSDQWGNITGGIDLVRRIHRAQVYGLTLPLVTKVDGTKFGKTESGTVWLDPRKTSPYAFYQFWLNTPDADVYRFLRLFTFLPVADLVEVERADAARAGRKEAQVLLARQLTAIAHGEAAVIAAERISRALFQGGGVSALGEEDLDQLKLDGIPYRRLEYEAVSRQTLAELMIELGLVAAGRQVRDALARGSISLNDWPLCPGDNVRVAALLAPERALAGRFFLLRFGKKHHHLLEVC